MRDDEPMEDYEQRLRDALHRVPAPDSDVDDVLARVQVGVRRRVRRRRVGAASLGAAAVLVAGVVLVPTQLDNDSTVADAPSATPPGDRLHQFGKHGSETADTTPSTPGKAPGTAAEESAGKATKATDISVSGIATNGSGNASMIGEGTCPGGPCLVTGSPDKPSTLRIAPSSDGLLKPMTLSTSTDDKPGIQVGSDPANSWAWTDALYSTHDAGKTWTPVTLPESLTVDDVESAAGRVWVFGERADGRPRVVSSQENADDWTTENVPVGSNESIETPMVVGGRTAFVASDETSNHSRFVQRTDDGWVASSVPCPEPVNSTSSADTVWLGCRTPNGSDLVTWSTDDGHDWHVQLVDQPGLSAVAGANDDRAVAAAGEHLIVVKSDGTSKPADDPYTASDDVWDGSARYDSVRIEPDGVGFATTNGGAIARTDDGGVTWKSTDLS